MKRFRCRAILFDLDGVLVDSIASVERNWHKWAVLNALDPAFVLSTVHGRRALDTIQIVAPTLPLNTAFEQIEHLEIADTTGVVATAGAARLLTRLPKAHWAVVTSGSRNLATARINTAGLPFPEYLVSADDVSTGKPDPEGYLKGASLVQAEPEHCLVIEDAVPGIQAAHAAGIPAIAVGSTFEKSFLQEAEAWVPTLEKLQLIVHIGDELPLEIIVHDPE